MPMRSARADHASLTASACKGLRLSSSRNAHLPGQQRWVEGQDRSTHRHIAVVIG